MNFRYLIAKEWVGLVIKSYLLIYGMFILIDNILRVRVLSLLSKAEDNEPAYTCENEKKNKSVKENLTN